MQISICILLRLGQGGSNRTEEDTIDCEQCDKNSVAEIFENILKLRGYSSFKLYQIAGCFYPQSIA